MTRLDPRLLLQGYATGIFPMADSRDADDLFWVEPRNRAIMPLDSFHLSRSLRRTVQRGPFTVTRDRDFHAVDRRLRRPSGNLDQCRDRTSDARASRLRPRPFDRSVATASPARRRPLWRQSRPRVLRRKHVQPRNGRVEGRACLARRAAKGRQFHASRLPVHDRPPRFAGRGDGAARDLCRVAFRRARRRRSRASAGEGGCRGCRPADFGALDTLLDAAGAGGAAGPAGYVITQLLGQTS